MLTYTENYTLTDHVKDIHYQVAMIPKALAFIRDCLGAGAL